MLWGIKNGRRITPYIFRSRGEADLNAIQPGDKVIRVEIRQYKKHQGQIKRTCGVCRKEFRVFPYKLRYKKGKYCSIKCSAIGRQKCVR